MIYAHIKDFEVGDLRIFEHGQRGIEELKAGWLSEYCELDLPVVT